MWLGAIQRVEARTRMSGVRFGDGLGGRAKYATPILRMPFLLFPLRPALDEGKMPSIR